MRLVVDGLEVHAATGGVEPSGDGPVMVLVHGAGADATAWQLQTRYLAHHGVRVLAVDLPGHGRSAGDPLPGIAELAQWLARLLTGSGPGSITTSGSVTMSGAASGDVGPVHVAGHSMGSFVGLELAARHPDLVASLTLLGTARAMPVHPELISASSRDLGRAAALMASWGHGPPAKIGPNPSPGLWMVGGARALVETGRAGALTADLEACAHYGGAAEAASRVACPVRVVVGQADRMTPAREAVGLASEFQPELASVTELPGVGHMLMSEAPGQVRRILFEAASSTADPGPRGRLGVDSG